MLFAAGVTIGGKGEREGGGGGDLRGRGDRWRGRGSKCSSSVACCCGWRSGEGRGLEIREEEEREGGKGSQQQLHLCCCWWWRGGEGRKSFVARKKLSPPLKLRRRLPPPPIPPSGTSPNCKNPPPPLLFPLPSPPLISTTNSSTATAAAPTSLSLSSSRISTTPIFPLLPISLAASNRVVASPSLHFLLSNLHRPLLLIATDSRAAASASTGPVPCLSFLLVSTTNTFSASSLSVFCSKKKKNSRFVI